MAEADVLTYWFGQEKTVFMAEDDGMIVDTYHLRSNQLGGGPHDCNCGYVTSSEPVGRGGG